MRYCPTCDAEYRNEIPQCTDDGTALLERKEWEQALEAQGRKPFDAARLVQVASFEDRFEADELASQLATDGVHVWLVRSKTPIVGVLAPAPAVWVIVVPEAEADRATALLAEARPAMEQSQAQAEAAAVAEEAAGEQAPV